jgi:hypothetical protein
LIVPFRIVVSAAIAAAVSATIAASIVAHHVTLLLY